MPEFALGAEQCELWQSLYGYAGRLPMPQLPLVQGVQGVRRPTTVRRFARMMR